jgi:serine/threonine-protein kinase
VSEIGRGAMGTVYKARDPKIDRVVAIKTILLHQTADHEQREFRDRFFVEAQAAGRLLHPGIVTVFDVGEDPETFDPYIVMEYIEGPTLRKLLSENNNRLQFDDALQITIELAEALDYAHAQGVVHRDIKPANILISKEGQAKIGDFGIAQLDLAHITVPGRVLGTPAYMSPEQLEGQQVDGRSDLFSLGAILYAVLTGFSPFQGSSATTVCYKVANHEPLEATALVPELPPELDAVIARALAKDPAKRYQRGIEFARDLRQLRERIGLPGTGKLWFSQAEGRRRFLDGTIKMAAVPPAPPPKTVPSPVKPAPVRKPLTILSSRKVQTAAAFAILLAAIGLNIFLWRQLRTQKLPPANIAEDVNQSKKIDSTQENEDPTGTSPHGESSAIKNAEMERAPAPVPRPKAALSTRSKPVVQATPKGVTPTASLASAQAVPKTAAPVVPRSVAKTGLPAGITPPASNANQVAVPSPPPGPALADSNLEVHIENHFPDASLRVWIDDKLAYEHQLRDGHKKRLILLGGGAKETVTIPLSAGHHALRVQVQSASEKYDETKSVAGEFVKGGQKIVSINFEKHSKEMRISLGDVIGDPQR